MAVRHVGTLRGGPKDQGFWPVKMREMSSSAGQFNEVTGRTCGERECRRSV